LEGVLSELPAGFCRFTVNYLAPLIINNGTGVAAHFGLLWRKGLKKTPPVTQYSAIGGGALVTYEGLEYLKSIGGASETKESLDARFFIPEDRIIEAAERFRTDPSLLIDGLLHELQGELCGDELGLGPIIPEARLANIREQPLGWMVMAGSPILRPDPQGRVREQDATSERLIRGFKLYVPPDAWDAMLVHPSIRRFTAEEVARTEEGLVVATANDGVTRIGNNMFLPSAFKE
jgi:hypothetical protein